MPEVSSKVGIWRELTGTLRHCWQLYFKLKVLKTPFIDAIPSVDCSYGFEARHPIQATVGSIVWAFRRLNKPRSREMSSCSYALHSVRPQRSFLSFHLISPCSRVKIALDAHLLWPSSVRTDSVRCDCKNVTSHSTI